MMVPANGYQHPGGPLPYPDDRPAATNMGLGMVPQQIGTPMVPQGYRQFVPIEFAAGAYPQSTPQTKSPPQNQKVKTQQPFNVPNPPGSLIIAPPPNFSNVSPMPNVQPSPQESPKSRAKGRGRGKGTSEETSPHMKGGGRARQSSQGMVIPIPNVSRDVALKEQAMKRRRVDGEQAQDNRDEEIIQDMLTRDTVDKGLAARKRKAEGKPPRREHHACDRCFRNKTKCHRSVDGKQPGKYFPCDYCTTINGICTTAVATSMKPESWPVAEETHWKTWKFKEIVSGAVEQDNLRVRKELATMQEKFSHHERLHECVKAELETEREHKVTLQKSLDTAYAFIKSTQQDAAKTNKILAAVTRQRDRYKNIVRQCGQSTSIDIPEAPSNCSLESTEDIAAAKAMMEDEDETKPHILNAEDMAPDESAEPSQGESDRELGRQDFPNVFQQVSTGDRLCTDILICNEYINAYFANIHPLAPILHKEAFLRLYKMYVNKAVGVNVQMIHDGSSRDGKAVGLICAVLALGALSVVESRSGQEFQDENRSELYMTPHFGEALGFYKSCIRLMSYTHDTIETMITYLLMALFAILSGDMKEAFRRLQNFQTQAIALRLPKKLGNMKPTDLYDMDLWPSVTNLIVSEMIKRSWVLFKVYLSNIAFDSGVSPNFDNTIQIDPPAEFDDEYVGFESISVAEFANKGPNPISFLIALGDVSKIVLETASTCWIREKTSRYNQLRKCREIWEQITAWNANLPTFLNFSKYSSAFAQHQQLKLQRAYLETQFTFLKMTVSWLIANLDPLLLHRAQLWDVGDACFETFQAGQRILALIEEHGLPTEVYRFYHWDAIRSAGTLKKLLRHVDLHGEVPTNRGYHLDVSAIADACRDSVQLARNLIPKILAHAENNLDNELQEFLLGKQASVLFDPAQLGDGGIGALMDPSNPYHHGAQFNFNRHPTFDGFQETFEGELFDPTPKREDMSEYPHFFDKIDKQTPIFGIYR